MARQGTVRPRTLSEFYRSPDYHGPYGGNVGPLGRLDTEKGISMMHTGSNQRVPEFHTWATLVRGMGAQSYVELGVGSAWSIRDAGVPRIVTVDLLPNGLSGIDHVQGDSHDLATMHQVLALLSGQPDIVFIDADHSYGAVQHDFDMWYPAARLAVGFHDILMDGVGQLWNEVKREYPSVEIIARDLHSAAQWQHAASGDLNVGGVGVIFK